MVSCVSSSPCPNSLCPACLCPAGVNDWGLKRLTKLTSLRCLNLDSRMFTGVC